MTDFSGKYVVQYTAGTCGTLLTWFINQHPKFVGGDFNILPENDIALVGSSQHWMFGSQSMTNQPGSNFETWQDVLTKVNTAVERKNIHTDEKICFKTFPHDIVNDLEDQQTMELAVSTLASAGATKWVYPMFYRSSKFPYETSKVANRKYAVIAERHKDPLWIANKNSGFASLYQTEDRHLMSNARMKSVISKYSIDVFYLDMAALLGDDQAEYYRLTDFLETDHITDWHGLLMSAVQFWEMPYA